MSGPRPLSAEELALVLEEGEGKQLEFKRGLSTDAKIARTLCAFANTRGGLLVVGVGDRGEILGVARPAVVAARLTAIAETTLEPPLALAAREVRIGRRALVYASIARSAETPHAVLRPDGEREIVVRVGSSNRAAEGATLRALGTRGGRARGEIEEQILAWLARRDARGARPGGAATAAEFARARNVGVQRARRAFLRLERSGLVVGHGTGTGRRYARP